MALFGRTTSGISVETSIDAKAWGVVAKTTGALTTGDGDNYKARETILYVVVRVVMALVN